MPPKDSDVGAAEPKELLSAATSPRGRSRGSVAMSSSTFGSRSSRVDGRGTYPWREREHRRDRLERAWTPSRRRSSTSRRVTHASETCSPSVAWSIRPLWMSPWGVEVARRRRGDRVGMIPPPAAPQDRRQPTAAERIRLGDVVGVGGDVGAEHLRVDPRTAGLCVLQGDASTSTSAPSPSTSRASGVPRPRATVVGHRGSSRVAIMSPNAADGQRWTAASCRRRQRRRPGPAGSGRSEGNALVAGRTGGDRGVHRGPRADVEADVGRRSVGHQHRYGQRRDPTGALLLQQVVVGEQRVDAADARGHRDADPVAVEVARRLGQVETAVLPGLHGRDQRELRGPVEAAGLDPLQDLGRFDRHRGSDLDRQLSAHSWVRARTPERPLTRPSHVPRHRHRAGWWCPCR